MTPRVLSLKEYPSSNIDSVGLSSLIDLPQNISFFNITSHLRARLSLHSRSFSVIISFQPFSTSVNIKGLTFFKELWAYQRSFFSFSVFLKDISRTILASFFIISLSFLFINISFFFGVEYLG